jgi:antitoxin component YwqK of YwqJK toxin-antitoxin module
MSLEECTDCCKQYGNDTNIVYGSYGEFIVVFRKLEDSITTENDKRNLVYRRNFAKFRADKLEVVCIFLKKHPYIQVKSIDKKYYENDVVTYTVGKIAKIHDYNTESPYANASGMTYFKSVEGAFYNELDLETYTGHYVVYNEQCGSREKEFDYVYGQKHGTCIVWRQCYNLEKEEYQYVNGKMYGTYKLWYKNGYKSGQCNYTNDMRHGQYNAWYECAETLDNDRKFRDCTGDKKQECHYVDGKLHGVLTEWYIGNIKKTEGTYVNGKACGQHIAWRKNGTKWIECNYFNGGRHRVEWQENGNKLYEYSYKNDKLHGQFFEYSEDGAICRKCEYDNGVQKLKLDIS